MSRFSEQTECKGFIQDLFLNMQKSMSAEQVKNFTNLDTDESRYKFVAKIKCVKEFQVTRSTLRKNAKIALDFKQKGNKAFQNKNYVIAIECYNKSLLTLPSENGM